MKEKLEQLLAEGKAKIEAVRTEPELQEVKALLLGKQGKLTELLAAGFTDSFRYLYPDATGMYSWWSMRFRARERNAGWRIDYFLVSDRLAPQIKKAEILMDVQGSDHCPVLLEL